MQSAREKGTYVAVALLLLLSMPIVGSADRHFRAAIRPTTQGIQAPLTLSVPQDEPTLTSIPETVSVHNAPSKTLVSIREFVFRYRPVTVTPIVPLVGERNLTLLKVTLRF